MQRGSSIEEDGVGRRRYLCRIRTPDVNWTAVLHAAATVVAVVGVFVFEQPVTVGLLVVAAGLFIGGIVLARRDEEPGA